jgi:hypothetical protein
MSQLYYNWFKMCYENEPPTVTESQLLTAVQRGMITEAEHQDIVGNAEPTPEAEPEPTPEEPIEEAEPTPQETVEEIIEPTP